ASVDEEEESAHAGDRRGEPDRDRHEVVHVVGQADGAGPRFRDSEPDRVPEEDPDDPVVEHRRADPQQLRFVDLARTGRPAELVLPPPPDVPADEDRKSTRLNSSHVSISYAVLCLKKKKGKRKNDT